MRKRLFIFAAATCFALSTFATPAFAEDTNLEDGQTISSEASVQSNGNSNGNSDFATPAFAKEPSLPDGQTINSEASVQSNGNSNGNSDENAKKDAPPSSSDDAGPKEESYSGEKKANAGVADPVAKIGGVGYSTLQEAINKANNGDVIKLQDNLTLTEGLQFIGSGDTANDWKNITIDAANKYKLTLNDLGIYATHCKVTIKDCPALTVHAGKNPGNANGEDANISAVLFCPGTLTLDNCKTVNITNVEPITGGGSGLCIYNGGDLCIQNNTNFTVSGFMNRTPVKPGEEGKGGCSGIYIDSDPDQNDEYKTIMGKIDVSNHSTLTATNCYHNGITANPINIFVSDHSTIDVHNNNKNSSGQGGLGCYFGKLTVTNNSHVTAHNNTSWGFAIFVKDLEVDGTSVIDANDNGGYTLDKDGLGLGGYGVAVCGKAVIEGTVEASGNWGPGLAVFDYHPTGHPTGNRSLTVKNSGKIVCSNNFNYGIANDGEFTVEPGGTVTLEKNWQGGFDNYPGATTTVEENANFNVTDNYGVGIKNGNNGYKDWKNKIKFTANKADIATLTLKSGLITKNHNNKIMPIPNAGIGLPATVEYGAGICNQYGKIEISAATKIYNNRADTAGDDLYNYKIDDNAAASNDFKVTVVPGANGCVLHDGKYIDYWYKDESSKRWSEDDAIQYTDSIVGSGDALKAAHGINAEIYVPEPEQPNEPKPNPAPEPKPDPKPEPKPDPAPAEPSASPEPDVTPTPTPAAAPSAIPQTGDTLPLVPLGLAALGSITALCVLQKRRKSKS